MFKCVTRQWVPMWIVMAIAFVGLGCGGGADRPPLGSVSGTVTLDGTPLVGVIVLFKPENGRAATGTTDAKGVYTLEYTYGVKGSKVGPSTVSFEWPLGFAGAKSLPAKYTTQSQMKEIVKEGRNTINLKLDSAETNTETKTEAATGAPAKAPATPSFQNVD